MSTAAVPEPESSRSAAAGGGAGTTSGGTGTTSGGHDRRRWLARLLATLERVLSREVNIFPYTTPQQATLAAAGRRTELAAALRREARSFHEIPSGLRTGQGQEESWGLESPTTAAIAMEWQLEDDLLLLLARVTDYVRAALARDRIRPVVVLKPLRRRLAKIEPDLFGWRVIIRTSDPRLVRRRLLEAVDSPGIGVDVAKAVPPRPQHSCCQGDGRRGVAPGRLRSTSGATYALTCAHVVAETCTCAAWPPQHVSAGYSGPDAVLLNDGCFPMDGGIDRRFTPASKDEWRKLGDNASMLRLGSSEGNRRGNLVGPMMGFFHEDGYCEMPSLTIEPRRLRYGILPWPLFKRGFSRDGDSGDWVVGGEGDNTWMGMIVQGSPSLSIAHQAPALLEYFDRELRRRTPGPGLTNDCSYVAP